MKKIRADMDRFFDTLDNRWRGLPLRKQHQYTLYLFFGYVLVTAGVIFQICYQMAEPSSKVSIEHIENPVLKKK